MAKAAGALRIDMEVGTAKLKAGFDKASAMAKSNGALMEKHLRNLDRRSKAVATSFSAMGRAISGTIALMAVNKVVQTADDYKRLENRLRTVTSTTKELRTAQGLLYDVAQRSYTSLDATTELYARIARNAEQLGLSQKQMVAITETVNKSFMLSGASAQEAAGGILQLSQAIASGELRGEELRSVMENAPVLAKLIADYVGVTIGEFRKMSKEGLITAQTVVNAIQAGQEKINAEFAKMTPTISMMKERFKNLFISIVGGANEASGGTSSIVTSLQGIANTVEQNKEGIKSFFGMIISAAGYAVKAVSALATSMSGLMHVVKGNLSFAQYATSNTKELGEMLTPKGISLALNDRLTDVSKRIKIMQGQKSQGVGIDEERLNKLLKERASLLAKLKKASDAAATDGNAKVIDTGAVALATPKSVSGGLSKAGTPKAVVTEAEKEAKKQAEAIQSVIDALEKKRAMLLDTELTDNVYELRENKASEATINSVRAIEAQIDALEAAKKIKEEIITPQEEYNKSIERANSLLAQQLISQDEFLKYQKKLQEELDKTDDKFQELKDAIEGFGQDAAEALAEFAMRGKISFNDMISSMIRDMIKMIAYQNIMKPLFGGLSGLAGNAFKSIGSLFGGGFGGGTQGGFAKGGAFQNGVQKFATGGIVSRPTIFPMARGLGLMGEAGAEAVMPLERIGGKLGVNVKGAGGGETIVNIINNSQSQVSHKQSANGNGGVTIDVMIDDIVRKKISSHGTGANKAIRSTFGATEKVISR
jgi:tape measure domain-containing protein